MTRRARWSCLLLLAPLLLPPVQCPAWYHEGHEKTTLAAVEALPDDVPAFFRQHAEAIAKNAGDPDMFRNKATPELTHADQPEHFFDLESLKGEKPPNTRYEFLALCQKLGVSPREVGTLPYAITETAEKLEVVFAEYRLHPDDPDVQAKCILYAGIVAHFTEDLCQPLHVTIDYNGRHDDPKRPTGIHDKVDDVLRRVEEKPEAVAKEIHPRIIQDWMKGILAEIDKSHALVDHVYEMEKQFPDYKDTGPTPEPVMTFAKDRYHAAAEFTASILLTAWERSETVKLPVWYTK